MALLNGSSGKISLWLLVWFVPMLGYKKIVNCHAEYTLQKTSVKCLIASAAE